MVEASRLNRARDRRETGRTLVEGPNLLAEALGAGVVPEVVFGLESDEVSAASASQHGVELLVVDPEALSRLAGTRSPRGPVAVVAIPSAGSLTGRPGALVSWGVGDPGNVGTLVRTAAGFGWAFAYTPGTADPWSPKVLRAGAGAQFRSRPVPISAVDDLNGAGYDVVATVVNGGQPVDRLGTGRYAVLVGGEAVGLPDDVVEEAAHRVSIPMPGGTESLNAAVAAAIVVYELSTDRAPAAEYGER